MHKYYIEHKIKTLADCVDPFEYKGFGFSHWDYLGGWNGHAWIANKTVKAENFLGAINCFRRELSSIVPKIGYVSQCFTTMALQPWLITRLDDNSEKNFLCLYTKEVEGVPLHFGSEEIKSLKKLESVDDAVFAYLNESNLAGSHFANLAMLITAIEGIAGEKKIVERCPKCKENINERLSTDKDNIKIIIDDEKLYKKLFGYGIGIRNLLFHGKQIDPVSFSGHESMNEDIFKKIGNYFNKNFGSSIDTQNITGPQRHFYENYEVAPRWLSCADKNQEIKLKDVLNELIIERDGRSMERYFHINSEDLMRTY